MPLKKEDPRQYVEEEYPLSDVTARIIAAAKEVHRTLGPGFEKVFYQWALALELPGHGLEFEREVWIDGHYKGRKLGRKRVDFVVEEVMVEIKAKAALEDVDFAQALSYLKASGQSGFAAELMGKEARDQATGELGMTGSLKH